jgi:RNA polymerase sigma-70 factor (ECF subfamily)
MSESSHREAFARVFAQNDRWLYAFLVSLVGNPADAEEVFQEVCVVLWREFEKFDLSTDFRRWASVIARHRVMRFRTVKNRQARQLSDIAIELLADEAVEQSSLLDDRRSALHDCLQKLGDSDRKLIAICYGDLHRSFQAASEQLGRPINTVYKALQRVRRALRVCIDRQLSSQA